MRYSSSISAVRSKSLASHLHMGLPCQGSFHDLASRKHLKATEATHHCGLNRKSRRDLTACRPELFPGTATIGQNLRHIRMRFRNLAQKRHRPVATLDVG